MAAAAMDWTGRRVVVTGGAGFLGSTVCRVLARAGAGVIALDAMLPEGGANAANLAGLPVALRQVDLRSDTLEPHLEGADALFDLAGATSHMGSQADPLGDLAHNATARWRLVLAARAACPGARVVYASTRQLYGRPQRPTVDESHPIVPPDANAIHKLAAEQAWLMEGRLHGRHVAVLRLSNCYGPGLRIRDARQTFLGVWIRRILEGEPFEVWGGEQLRDLTHADDVADAMLRAAATPTCAGRALNVAGQAPIALAVLAQALLAAHGGGTFTVRDFPAERAAIDIGSFVLDDAAFRAATGWAPRIALAEGLRGTLDWYATRLPLYLQDRPA